MTKAVLLPLGLIFLLSPVATLPAQDAPADMAVNQAVMRQAYTIELRQKLSDARGDVTRGDLSGAAKLYEDAYSLVAQIGSGIDAETAQTVSGLVSTRLELAHRAQEAGDLLEADTQVTRALRVDPHNSAALAFKKQNDQLLASMKGRMPDQATLERIPAVNKEKTDAGTLVQDGKLLYEMGKFEEAEVKLDEALKLDPNNQAVYYYLNLIKQARYAREEHKHTTDTQTRMTQVASAWEPPINHDLPVPNPYASTNLIFTGLGRQAIVSKLDRIRLDTMFYDGLPLTEVIRNLSEQAKLRDPDRKGINFLINPNGDTSGGASAAPGAPVAVDSTTGLQVAPAAGGGESVDIGSVIIKINPALSDISLADALDAVVSVADHPIKYSIEDYAIVFSAKGPESPQLYTRTYRVDANTFYQGLQSVASLVFGSAAVGTTGAGGNTGGTTGGGSGGGTGGSTISGAVVPVVNISPGAGAQRGGAGAGGAGAGGGGIGGAPGAANGNGGVNFLTTVGNMQEVSVAAQTFFKTLGVDLTLPGKSIFFNDRLGELYVRGTAQDLDTIEDAIHVLNQVPPQIHIKARFIEVEQDDSAALGFDWYLGQFGLGNSVVASGGSAPSLSVPVSAANPLGAFPGSTAAGLIAGSAGDQLITGGLQNSGPALATITGILTDPNFRVVLHALDQRGGIETLAEPEVVTTSGRQTQMRATEIQSIITGVNFQQGTTGTTTGTTTTP